VPTYLEEWEDDVPPVGHAGEAVALGQPVVEAFRDTRAMPDILIAAAKELGGPVAAALPWNSFRECLDKAYAGMGIDIEAAYRSGGIFSGIPDTGGKTPKAGSPALPEAAEASFAGDPARYPLVLHVYPSIAHFDGRGANLPWLQELPDPLVTAVWRNWVEVGPKTAAALGLSDGDGVTVESPFGSLQAFVFLHPAIAEGVAAMPLGQGHSRYGRFAADRGGNPYALLPASMEGVTNAPARQSTRVSIARTKVKGALVRTVHPEGQWLYENIL
jgi:anaerobic selenocysteine-containing dehydrogenase